MKKILSLLLTFAFVLSACSNGPVSTNPNTLKVVATFYPLAYFAQRIGGEQVEVTNLTPTGGEPHNFEPSPRQIVAVTEADVALYMGLGFEPWMEDLKIELAAKEVIAVEVNSRLPVVQFSDEEGAAEESDAYDPHTWLDPLLAQEMVTMILQAFIKADPESEAVYTANAKILLEELQALHESYQTDLASCDNKTILVSHEAFHYFAKRYGIETVSVSGISPEDEPSANRLTQLADFAKENESKYIFFETLANPDVAQTLADEADLTPLTFNPVEGLTVEEAQNGGNYFTLMQSNLANLKLAMSCQQAL